MEVVLQAHGKAPVNVRAATFSETDEVETVIAGQVNALDE